MYRVGGDVRAKYASVMKHLQDIDSYAQRNLSRPGCWAYLDMVACPPRPPRHVHTPRLIPHLCTDCKR